MAIFSLGFCGSLVSMTMVFLNFRPPYPVVSPLMVMVPSPPGGICFVYETAVHPQPVRTLRMSNGALPLFCILNTWVTSVPSGTISNLYSFSGMTASGTSCADGAANIIPELPIKYMRLNKINKGLIFMPVPPLA